MEHYTLKTKNQFDVLLDSIVNKLSPEGWTLPSQMTLGIAHQMARTSGIDDINTFLYSFFTRDDYSVTKAMINNISTSCISLRLKRITNECWSAFQNRLYAVCSIALLTVIEGILSSFSNDKQDVRMMKICKNQISHYSNDGWISLACTVEKHVWISYYDFIRNLYQKSDFASDEPSKLNRHWLLHGRSDYNIDEIDCIRLFNAVDSLCMVVEKDAELGKDKGN